MGLSASQARLLSITARLSDNELHSQQIANSRVRLADKTQEASQEYINALNTTKLMYTTYDAQGNASEAELTPGLLYTYEPLKNQYLIQDSSGAVYVSAIDAKNFENTNSLMEFLNCYDLFSDDKYKESLKNYEEKLNDYTLDLEKYKTDKAQFDKDIIEYNTSKAEYEAKREKYLQELEEWRQNQNEANLYDKFAGFVGTSDNPNKDVGFCYSEALGGAWTCYLHLLAHLLDWGGGTNFNFGEIYETSYIDPETGKKETTSINNMYASGGMDNVTLAARTDEWLEIVDAINDPERVCDGDDNYNGQSDGTKENNLQQIIDEGRVPTKKEILISDYLYDPDTNSVIGIKTLKQKAIDLLYLLNNNSDEELKLSAEEMRETLINFTDGDMRNLGSPPEEPPEFTLTAPVMPVHPGDEPVKPNPTVEIADKEKAQWYVNLWYMMNGSDTANLVKNDPETELDGVFVVEAAEKSSKGNYKVLDDSLMTSGSWLQYSLEHGAVTLLKASYSDPSEDSGKAQEITSDAITWSSVIFSSCVEISSVEDTVAITRAEAEYTEKINEIEAKDNKLENDIKKLDTEHNALQTEYESVKSVIDKNIERSFKAFS